MRTVSVQVRQIAVRLKEAAKNDAEAKRIRVIAEAEVEARSKELQDVGIARQRLAIANPLKESVAACAAAGISSEETSKMVLWTQHCDTVTAEGAQSKSVILMVPCPPGDAPGQRPDHAGPDDVK